MAGNIFKKLPPKIRQYATLGGVSAAILGVVYLGVSSQESGQTVRNDNVIKNVDTYRVTVNAKNKFPDFLLTLTSF